MKSSSVVYVYSGQNTVKLFGDSHVIRMHDSVELSADIGFFEIVGLKAYQWRHYKDNFRQKRKILFLVKVFAFFSQNRDSSSIELATSDLKDPIQFIKDLGLDVSEAGIFEGIGMEASIRKMDGHLQELFP